MFRSVLQGNTMMAIIENGLKEVEAEGKEIDQDTCILTEKERRPN